MGDHRITLNIRAEFHGKVYEIKNAWWNYNGHQGVDERVITFFENMWTDGYNRWWEDVHAEQIEHEKREAEQRERQELVRLKAKYER